MSERNNHSTRTHIGAAIEPLVYLIIFICYIHKLIENSIFIKKENGINELSLPY
ncbi:hypothetical protein SAMN05518872_102194 [Psychrobacillus sp. OK032]|nr:hypothetical protein SAMN05518872_102194 [Psychrobacillus sp. OK032]